MAIEDAAAFGILFSKPFFNGDIAESLAVYEEIRLPRATRVQSAAAKAAYNINERIGMLNSEFTSFSCLRMFTGFSNNVGNTNYKVEDEKNKLTIEEMNAYVFHYLHTL